MINEIELKKEYFELVNKLIFYFPPFHFSNDSMEKEILQMDLIHYLNKMNIAGAQNILDSLKKFQQKYLENKNNKSIIFESK
ncbi:MAG TPA: hypothetical protein PKY81_17640 [bacterium]|nr:hypothetical protein [bacterium]